MVNYCKIKYKFGFMAVSLGYFETLLSCSASSTSSEMTDEDLQRAGIEPGLLRISIGLTRTIENRWQQLQSALVEIGVRQLNEPHRKIDGLHVFCQCPNRDEIDTGFGDLGYRFQFDTP